MNSCDSHASRCGDCRHAVRTPNWGPEMVACVVLLEYRSAEQIQRCDRFHSIFSGESAAMPFGFAA